MNVIKIFGAPRSGTTYVQWLITNNFRSTAILTSILGGKHGFPPKISKEEMLAALPIEFDRYKQHLSWMCSPDFKDDFSRNYYQYIKEVLDNSKLKYILCFKNPYSWVVSKKKIGMCQDVKNSLIHWNNINNDWLSFYDKHEDSCFIIKYEDLLINFQEVLGRLENKFNFIRSAEEFVNNNKHLAPSKISDKYDKTYYLENKFMNDLSNDEISIFRDVLSVEVVDRLNYKIL